MPYWKAAYWQEKVSDLFIIVTTEDADDRHFSQAGQVEPFLY